MAPRIGDSSPEQSATESHYDNENSSELPLVLQSSYKNSVYYDPADCDTDSDSTDSESDSSSSSDSDSETSDNERIFERKKKCWKRAAPSEPQYPTPLTRRHQYGMMDPLKKRPRTDGYEPCNRQRGSSSLIQLPRGKSTDGTFDKPKFYGCHFCSEYRFLQLPAYLRHVRRRHMQDLFVCEICQKRFANHAELHRHQKPRIRCRKPLADL